MTALEASSFMAAVIGDQHELIIAPIADGGDGTAEILGKIKAMTQHEVSSLDALGRPKTASYYTDNDNITYLDLADCSGVVHLKPNELNPFSASSYGTGLVIKKAIEEGSKHIVLGLGGSASIDLGLGILSALGLKMYDHANNEVKITEKEWIKKVKSILWDDTCEKDVRFTLLCDVDHQFWGDEGAIPVFGPQKGLSANDLDLFSNYIFSVYELLRKSNPSLVDRAYYGAAGGIAVGLSCYYPLDIQTGSDYVFKSIGMDQKIQDSDFIVTGEGRYDEQSNRGKACYKLLQLAKKHKKPAILISSGKPPVETHIDHYIQLEEIDLSKDKQEVIISNFRAAADKVKTILMSI